MAAVGLHGVDPGHPVERAEADGLAQGLDARAGQRAPADLHHDMVEADGFGHQIRDDLVRERLAAFDDQTVLAALTGEGNRAPGDLVAQAGEARVARNVRRPRTGHHVGPEFVQRSA